jgi:hypothetical protein
MNIDYYNPNDEDQKILTGRKTNKYLINLKKVPNVKFSEVKLTFENIHEFINPADGWEGYLSTYSEFGFLEYKFQQMNSIFPNVFRIEHISGDKFISNLFKYHDIPDTAYAQNSYQDGDFPKMNGFLISFTKDLILYFDSENGCALYYDKKYQKDKNSLFYKILGLLRTCKQPKVTKNQIYVVYRASHGFDKTGFDVKKISINLSENYNDDFIQISEDIIKGLNDKDKSNLVILSGIPGVGKTYFCRYLTSKLKKNIIFISPDMVESITDPAFIPFLMKNNDSILIIEDAEPALEKRTSGGRSSAVSNVLNLTDGLLSDCLNISIIATFNTTKKTIDEALLRKGRLLMNYRFEKLSVEKSKALLKKLGNDVDVKEPMTLANIYYYGIDNNPTQGESKKIGFYKEIKKETKK